MRLEWSGSVGENGFVVVRSWILGRCLVTWSGTVASGWRRWGKRRRPWWTLEASERRVADESEKEEGKDDEHSGKDKNDGVVCGHAYLVLV